MYTRYHKRVSVFTI